LGALPWEFWFAVRSRSFGFLFSAFVASGRWPSRGAVCRDWSGCSLARRFEGCSGPDWRLRSALGSSGLGLSRGVPVFGLGVDGFAGLGGCGLLPVFAFGG
jgi:hypothetical protein